MAKLHELAQSMREQLTAAATVKKVFGDPIQAGDKTIIPIARIGFGFGGGAGPEDATSDSIRGGGFGGGVGAVPVGVLEVTPGETRFIPFTSKKRLAVAAVTGFVAGMLLAKRLR